MRTNTDRPAKFSNSIHRGSTTIKAVFLDHNPEGNQFVVGQFFFILGALDSATHTIILPNPRRGPLISTRPSSHSARAWRTESRERRRARALHSTLCCVCIGQEVANTRNLVTSGHCPPPLGKHLRARTLERCSRRARTFRMCLSL